MKIVNIKSIILKVSQSYIKSFFAFVLVSTLVYFNSLSYDFTSLDDYDLIVNKFYFLNEVENIPAAFKTNLFMSESGVYYRPLITISFIIDSLIGGRSQFTFHLSNIIYHIAAGFLLFILLIQIIKDALKAFLFVILFLVHPALVQAVVWIPGRNDSLLALNVFLSFLFFLKFFDQKNIFGSKNLLFILLSTLFFLLALFTKENALLLLFLFPFYLFYVERKNQNFSKFVFFLSGLVVALLVYLHLRLNIIPTYFELEKISLGYIDYIAGSLNYIGKIFFPFNLSVVTLPENINTVYGLISIVVISILCLRGIKNVKLFFFGVVWFIVFIISGMVAVTGFTNFLDHRLYVPIFGIILMVSQLKILENLSLKIRAILFSIILISFLVLNSNHSNSFKDPLTFYTSAVESAPNSFFVQRGLANIYFRLKEYDLAEIHYRKALNLNPESTETLNNLALNYKKKNKLDSAEIFLLQSLKLNPNHSVTNNNLGSIYIDLNRLDDAEYYLKKAIAINKNYYEAFNNLGVLFAKKGNSHFAYKNFRRSVEINPYFAEGFFNLALYYYNRGEIDSSKYYYQKAILNGFPTTNVLNERLKR